MFQEDLQPHCDQNDAAGDFGFALVFYAKYIADLYPNYGEKACDHADKSNGGKDEHL